MMRHMELAAFEKEEREAGAPEKPPQRYLHVHSRGPPFEAPKAKMKRFVVSHNVTSAERQGPDAVSSPFAPVAQRSENYVAPVSVRLRSADGIGSPVASRSASLSNFSPDQPFPSADSAFDSRMSLRLQAWMMEETKLRTEFQKEMESARMKQQQQLDSIETLVTAILVKMDGKDKKVDAIHKFVQALPAFGSEPDNATTTIAGAVQKSAQETTQEGQENSSTSSTQPPAMRQNESVHCSQNISQPMSRNADQHSPLQAGHRIENLAPAPRNGETLTRECVDGMKQGVGRRESMEDCVLEDLLFAQHTSPTDVAISAQHNFGFD